MKAFAAVAVLVLALGCIGDGNPRPVESATTSTVATTSTLESTTTSSTAETTTTTQAAVAACDALNASFWRALCYDDEAYLSGETRYCRTVYCLARFSGAGECDGVRSDDLEWFAYKKTACLAWAGKSPFICDPIMKSGDCIRWYALLQVNMSLCVRAQNNPGDDCAREFATWRGDLDACNVYRTMESRSKCQDEYYRMMAVDNQKKSYCDSIMNPNRREDCRQNSKFAGDPNKHPLYGVDKQLITP